MQKVASEMACLRQSSRVETPASASQRILMICWSKHASSRGCPHVAYVDITEIAVCQINGEQVTRFVCWNAFRMHCDAGTSGSKTALWKSPREAVAGGRMAGSASPCQLGAGASHRWA